MMAFGSELEPTPPPQPSPPQFREEEEVDRFDEGEQQHFCPDTAQASQQDAGQMEYVQYAMEFCCYSYLKWHANSVLTFAALVLQATW